MSCIAGSSSSSERFSSATKKEYERLADHIGLYPLGLISPKDAQLILGGSEERRKFVDGVISQYQHDYLQHLLNYNKALAQRNALLKLFAERRKFDAASLEIWDEQLLTQGGKIFEERKAFFDAFLPVFNEYYAALSGGNETVNIDYQSTLLEGDFAAQLMETREKDRIMQFTTTGIHKDELVFYIHDVPVKRFGSQGQQKSFLIALKLAQFSFTRKVKGLSPILLFDDIFDKLDEDRVEHLMRLVSDDSFGQVFVTDTNLERLVSLFQKIGGESRIFLVESGNITKISNANPQK